MKRFFTALVLLAMAAVKSACTDSNDGSGGGSCSALEGAWEGDEIDEEGNIQGSAEMVGYNGKIKATILQPYDEDETYSVTVNCNENTNPKRMKGAITASSYQAAVGKPFYSIFKYEGNKDKVKWSGFKPGSTTYPSTFSAGNGQRLFELHRVGMADSGIADGGDGGEDTSRSDTSSDAGESKTDDGLIVPAKIYKDNGDGTVTDETTGLTWMRCSAGQSGSNCPEASSANEFRYTWQEAMDYCDNLSFMEHDDWRLPEIREWVSIAKYSTSTPTALPVSNIDRYWSSSSNAYDNSQAFWIDFGNLEVRYIIKTNKNRVRCVRGGPMVIGSFTTSVISGERVVRDTSSGLMWQGCAAGQSGESCDQGSSTDHSYYVALNYCDDLTWARYSDWRLPDLYELSSIVDYTKNDPAIDEAAFPSTPSTSFWSRAVNFYAHIVDFGDFGSFTDSDTLSAYSVRCVRNGP